MSPEMIHLGVPTCVRFPYSLRDVEDLLHERDIDFCRESVRRWGDRFGRYFVSKIRKWRSAAMRWATWWCWHLHEAS